MTTPPPLSSAADAYLDEAAAISAYGLPVLSEAQAAKVAASPAGPYLLRQITTAFWDLESADRSLRSEARRTAEYAAEIVSAVEGHLHIPGSVGGETWVTSSARKVQEHASARKAAIERIQAFTAAADQIVNG